MAIARTAVEEKIENDVKRILPEIKAQTLIKALSLAKNSYLYDQKEPSVLKHVGRGMDVGYMFRSVKAHFRTPEDLKITDENVISTLFTILNGWGGSNLKSLKYNLYKYLFPQSTQAQSDAAAEICVNIFKKEVSRVIKQAEQKEKNQKVDEFVTVYNQHVSELYGLIIPGIKDMILGYADETQEESLESQVKPKR